MTELYRYAAFISYSSKDRSFAKRLHQVLEQYSIPRKLGQFDLIGGGGKPNRIYPIFRDRDELPSGDLGREIEAALRASKSLIVVGSQGAAASPWVAKEVEYFQSLGRRDQVFGIVSSAAPENESAVLAAFFPPSMRTADYELIAGDARSTRTGHDGFRAAMLKVVAGLIGRQFGDLVDRDKARGRQRALAMSIAALGLTVAGLAGLRFAIAPLIQAEVSVATERTRTTVQREEAGRRVTVQLDDLAGQAVQSAITDATTDGFLYHTDRGMRLLREGLRGLNYTEEQVPVSVKEYLRLRGRMEPTFIVENSPHLARDIARAMNVSEGEAVRILRERPETNFRAPQGLSASLGGSQQQSNTGVELTCERHGDGTIITVKPNGQRPARMHQVAVNFCGPVFWSSTDRYVGILGTQSLLVFSGTTGELLQRFPVCGPKFGKEDIFACGQDADGLARGTMIGPALDDYVGIFFDERRRLATYIRPDPRSLISERTRCALPALLQFDLGAIEDMTFDEQLENDDAWPSRSFHHDERATIARRPWYEWQSTGPRPWCSSIY